MTFPLFVLLTGVLLIRPEELFPAIAGVRLYLISLGLCLLAAGPRLMEVLRPAELTRRPITACVLGVLAAGVLSQLARGHFGSAADFVEDFGKAILYYLLLVAVLDTPHRLRAFLGWVVVFVVVQSGFALLQYHEVIDNPALRPLERREVDPTTGELVTFQQLRGSGIYNDPNDLCLALVTGGLCALYRSVAAGGIASRVLWLLPIGLFGYAVVLTRSRGGLLGLIVAVLVWGYGYFGWRKMLPVTLAVVPVLAILGGGGRQTNITIGKGDTGHQRVELWAEGFSALMRNPVTGIGVGEYAEEMGLVAHNSFVHAYVEMGLLGGGLFLGAFYLAVVGLHRARPPVGSAMARLRPFVAAIVLGYAGGIFSISRDYTVPTYLVLGLAAAYLRLAPPSPPGWYRLDGRMVARLCAVALAGLIGLRVLTSLLLRLSG
jgi:putative inorganic carbon (HCO3(-)) transporter